jgi:hypothetical protein
MGRTMGAVQRERQAGQTRVAELEAELVARDLAEQDEARALEYATNVGAGLDTLDQEGRQRFLRDVVKEVRFDGRHVTIRTIIPTGGDGGPGAGSFVQLLCGWHLLSARRTGSRTTPPSMVSTRSHSTT